MCMIANSDGFDRDGAIAAGGGTIHAPPAICSAQGQEAYASDSRSRLVQVLGAHRVGTRPLEAVMDEQDGSYGWLAPALAAGDRPSGRRAAARGLRDVPDIGFESEEEQQCAEEAFLSLSAREVTVLAYLSYGFSAKEVAISLDVSSRTIDTFRTRALLKLRARNTADAVRILATLSARAWLVGD
jgi:DNA-binding CsgD family transcriptional regulator